MCTAVYDLTSTYFEGEAEQVTSAARGYSRDHRPDCLQIVIALVVTPEGLPLSYEIFPGNRLDVTTLKEILEAVEAKYGRARRLWVFDRGIVSEENLACLRERGAHYLVGTPKHRLKAYERQLLEGAWEKVSSEVEVQLVPEADEVYVLCRSRGRLRPGSGCGTRSMAKLRGAEHRRQVSVGERPTTRTLRRISCRMRSNGLFAESLLTLPIQGAPQAVCQSCPRRPTQEFLGQPDIENVHGYIKIAGRQVIPFNGPT